MEGIQLLGAPSMNLKPGSKRSAQNIGTSGSETRKPPSAKKFAIQRMASLLSLGTNRSTRAPTSGVKRMIESIWFCMKVLSCSASGATTLVVHVIEHETYQARGHHQRVPLDQTPLEQTCRIRQHARENRRTVDADSVDDPFVPPTGNRRRQARDPAGGVDRAIHHIRVKPRGRFAQPQHAEADISQLATAGE